MEWWKLLYWLIGTLGVAGAIALVAVYPAIMAGVIRFFGLVFSYRIGCALVAAGLAAFIADYHRHSIDDADFAARTAAFEQGQDARDEKIRVETRDAVWTEIANETAAQAGTKTEAKELKDALPPIPATDTVCRVGPNRDRLRIIAGASVSKSPSVKRVPASRRPRVGA